MSSNPQIFLQFKKGRQKSFMPFDKRAVASVFDEIDIAYVRKKIVQTIGDREAAIEIGIGDHFWNGDRDRDLNFGDRDHALPSID